MAGRSGEDLLEWLPKESQSSATVFLHYVGYGYAGARVSGLVAGRLGSPAHSWG